MTSWFEDLEVIRFIKRAHPPSLEEEKEFIEQAGRDANTVFWAIEHAGKLVGVTGINRIDWRHGFGTTGTLIGDKRAWGKGLGRELMQLRAAYAFTQLPLRKLKSAYLAGNEASARAQKSAGYREIGRWHRDRFADGKWVDVVMTELLREDWEKAQV